MNAVAPREMISSTQRKLGAHLRGLTGKAIADYKMIGTMLAGEMQKEVERARQSKGVSGIQ